MPECDFEYMYVDERVGAGGRGGGVNVCVLGRDKERD